MKLSLEDVTIYFKLSIISITKGQYDINWYDISSIRPLSSLANSAHSTRFIAICFQSSNFFQLFREYACNTLSIIFFLNFLEFYEIPSFISQIDNCHLLLNFDNRIEEAKRAIKRPHDRYEERDRERDREPDRKRSMGDRTRFEPPPPPRFDSTSSSRWDDHNVEGSLKIF